MKAFLLAAGHGTRLRPLTDSTPKCLLPIQGRPMLDWWLERCRDAGVTEVRINLHAHGPQVQRHIEDAGFGGYVSVSEEPVLLGSAGTIAENESWIGDDGAFWVFYADVLTNLDLRQFFAFHERYHPSATLGVTEVTDPSRCGVVTVDDGGVVTSFEEKPARPSSNLAFSGIMVATKQFLRAIPTKRPADIGYDVLPVLGGMRVYRVNDYLLDIGTMANYSRAQETWPGWNKS